MLAPDPCDEGDSQCRKAGEPVLVMLINFCFSRFLNFFFFRVRLRFPEKDHIKKKNELSKFTVAYIKYFFQDLI